MGMLIVAVAGGLRLIELETLAAVVSILSLTNSVLSLWGQVGQVHWRLVQLAGLRSSPGAMLGLFFLDQLGANARWALELCLGVFLTLGGLRHAAKTAAVKTCFVAMGRLADRYLRRHAGWHVFCQRPRAGPVRFQPAAAVGGNQSNIAVELSVGYKFSYRHGGLAR